VELPAGILGAPLPHPPHSFTCTTQSLVPQNHACHTLTITIVIMATQGTAERHVHHLLPLLARYQLNSRDTSPPFSAVLWIVHEPPWSVSHAGWGPGLACEPACCGWVTGRVGCIQAAARHSFGACLIPLKQDSSGPRVPGTLLTLQRLCAAVCEGAVSASQPQLLLHFTTTLELGVFMSRNLPGGRWVPPGWHEVATAARSCQRYPAPCRVV